MARFKSRKFEELPARSKATASLRDGSLDAAINVGDLRRRARKRLPRVVFDYVDGGAQDEMTLRANRQAFNEIVFRPRQAVRHSHYTTSTQVLGLDLSIPVLLAPVGYSRLFHPDGEIGAAAAAGAAG